jgi:hypothetical protein
MNKVVAGMLLSFAGVLGVVSFIAIQASWIVFIALLIAKLVIATVSFSWWFVFLFPLSMILCGLLVIGALVMFSVSI